MPLEIITVLIAKFAGTSGYFFREYSSKSEPFFQILTINGDITRTDDAVTITPKLIEDLNDTFYLPTLDPTGSSGSVVETVLVDTFFFSCIR